MSKRSRNGCGWECCPSGFIEHCKNYRYSRWAYGIGFWKYWKWEFECWIGMHKVKDEDLEDWDDDD
jgi:hypothetical protein